MDGAVVKVNDIKTREELGQTSKVPKWAVAYKYPPEARHTKIKEIWIYIYSIFKSAKIESLKLIMRGLNI